MAVSRFGALLGAAALALLATPASAQDTIKVAYIDPLSGAFANVGELGVHHFQYVMDEINAKGGVLGKKFELVPLDSKANPQDTQIALKKVIDDGIRIVTQGNGSNVAHAIVDTLSKHNEREPGKAVLYLNYAAVDPALTNDKCSFWHFRFDADADMKMEALTNFLAKQPNVKKLYLINQDYSFGKAVAAAASSMTKKKRPDIQIVGDELHPLGKVQDFSPYVAKIKASGADAVITGNWGNDLTLLVKAAKDAGLGVDWYTYYAGGLGTPAAIGQAGKDRVKQITEWHSNVEGAEMDEFVTGYRKRYNEDYYYLRTKNLVEMLARAIEQAKSTDPAPVAKALEGMRHQAPTGEIYMRADNHQLIQPLFISTMSAGTKRDVENTGLGFKTDGRIEAKDTETPTSCKMKRPS
ncbi:MAG: branched-chain amino acid ABC transporter substrate-binding protein [Pseudomonadota bacterium]|nr:branched-chain amino acid ABC transporter substrate-binding protein [Pseudomonadota bacterium]